MAVALVKAASHQQQDADAPQQWSGEDSVTALFPPCSPSPKMGQASTPAEASVPYRVSTFFALAMDQAQGHSEAIAVNKAAVNPLDPVEAGLPRSGW